MHEKAARTYKRARAISRTGGNSTRGVVTQLKGHSSLDDNDIYVKA